MPDVRQSGFALLGDLAKSAVTHLHPHLQPVLQAVHGNLDPEFLSVCNNACWSVGELAVRSPPASMSEAIGQLVCVRERARARAYIYFCVFVCVHMYTCVCACIYMCVCAYTHVCMCVCVVIIHTHTHTHTHTSLHQPTPLTIYIMCYMYVCVYIIYHLLTLLTPPTLVINSRTHAIHATHATHATHQPTINLLNLHYIYIYM